MFPDIFNKALKQNNKREGLTLLEVIMSITILGITAMAMILPFTESSYLALRDQRIIDVNNLAKQYLNEVQDDWKHQTEFDVGDLPDVTTYYTQDGAYEISPTSVCLEDVTEDEVTTCILRRVEVTYEDTANNIYGHMFIEVNRPTPTLN